MPAGSTNILIEKGSDFTRSFTFRDKTSKVATDLTGAALEFKVAAKQGGPTLFEIPMTIVSPAVNGKAIASYPKEDVELVTIKEGWFVINITWSNLITERLIEGRIVVSKGVL